MTDAIMHALCDLTYKGEYGKCGHTNRLIEQTMNYEPRFKTRKNFFHNLNLLIDSGAIKVEIKDYDNKDHVAVYSIPENNKLNDCK